MNSEAREKSESKNAYFALVAVCLAWGTTYLANKVGVMRAPPLGFSSIRMIIAGSCILGYRLWISKEKFPPRFYLTRQWILGFCMITCGNGFALWGLQHIPSGISALIAASIPLFVALQNLLFNKKEKLSFTGWGGILLGLIGVSIFYMDRDMKGSGELYVYGLIATLMSIALWSTGTVLSRRWKPESSPFFNAGFQLLTGGVTMYLIHLCIEPSLGPTLDKTLILALVYLVLVGSFVGYAAYIYALTKLPASVVSIYAYVNPLIAVFVGYIFLGEILNPLTWIAGVFILASIYLVNRGQK